MRGRLPLALCLFVYLVLTAALIFRVRLGDAPDETAHWQYVNYIAKYHALPVFQGQPPPQEGYEYHQPPLYYLICAPFWAALTGHEAAQQLACRLVNLAFGLATLTLIWATARLLFPSRPGVALLATGYAALWPLHQAVGAASGNDALAGFLCAALFYLIARGIASDWGTRDVALTGLCMAAGLYTKNTCLVVAVAALGAVLLSSAQKRTLSRGVLSLVTVFAIAFMLALPLMFRNQVNYGDPFGIAAFQKAATLGTPGYPQFSVIITLPDYARGILLITLVNAWGIFGGPDRASRVIAPLSSTGAHLPTWTLVPLLIILAASALTGLGLYRSWNRTPETGREPWTTSVWRWWALGVGLIIVAWLQFSYNHLSGAQARYLHPALLPVCIIAAAGWAEFWGKGRNGVLASVVLGLVLLALSLGNILGWRTLV
jgi:hypothetical protein